MAAKVLDITKHPRRIRTREAHDAKCHTCEHTWVAPTIGKCPRCNSEDVTTLGRRHFDYVRS